MQFASVCLKMFRSNGAQRSLPLFFWSLRLWGVGFVQTLCYPRYSSSIPKALVDEMSRVWAMYRTIAYTSSSSMAFSRCIIFWSTSENTFHLTLLSYRAHCSSLKKAIYLKVFVLLGALPGVTDFSSPKFCADCIQRAARTLT